MNDKNLAAKRLVDALISDLDFDLWLGDHPNEERATERLLRDIEQVEAASDRLAD